MSRPKIEKRTDAQGRIIIKCSTPCNAALNGEHITWVWICEAADDKPAKFESCEDEK